MVKRIVVAGVESLIGCFSKRMLMRARPENKSSANRRMLIDARQLQSNGQCARSAEGREPRAWVWRLRAVRADRASTDVRYACL